MDERAEHDDREHDDRDELGEQEFITAEARKVPGVLTMVGYRAAGQPESTHLGVPSATVTVILSFEGPVVGAQSAAELAAGRVGSTEVVVAGLHERATHVHQPSHQQGVQLAVHPLAARGILGVPAAELPHGVQDCDASERLRSLWLRTADEPDWNARFSLVAGQFERWAAGYAERGTRRGLRPDIAEAWRVLAKSRGRASVADVAREVHLSERQLRDQFHREFGVSPKAAARLMRFDRALSQVRTATRSGEQPSMARVAATCGYADQSHFTREARGFLGMSPGQWAAQERRNLQAGGHGFHTDSAHDFHD